VKIVVTGGAGFIGSAVVRHLIGETAHEVVTLDKLTYAGSMENLRGVLDSSRHTFVKADICDRPTLDRILMEHEPDAIMHLAAESHVDRSIDGPMDFIQTNIIGTYTLLESARSYLEKCEPRKQDRFRFHHISTDEVYGSLGKEGLFTETTRYRPNSPYSASKASSDHLVRAWNKTYNLPVVTSNCSNNYGPYQFPEKLIPLVILNAVEAKPLPVYGKGENVRDWLYVDDHARALVTVLTQGKVGETYNIGGHNEKTNIEVVHTICEILQRILPNSMIRHYKDLIAFVKDRPGHDLRYAIDASKIERELGWRPRETFETGMEKTVRWYLDNSEWCNKVQAEKFARNRVGLGGAK